jgi:hypothetical protein
MHDNGSKYIYIKDSFGELLGTIGDTPSNEDTVFIKAIAQRPKGDDDWDLSVRDVDMGVRLTKGEIVKLYDNHEIFCEEFFDAIL